MGFSTNFSNLLSGTSGAIDLSGFDPMAGLNNIFNTAGTAFSTSDPLGTISGAGQKLISPVVDPASAAIAKAGGDISEAAKVAGGQAASPEGRALIGSNIAGPIGGLAGMLSSQEGRDQLTSLITSAGEGLGGFGVSQGVPSELLAQLQGLAPTQFAGGGAISPTAIEAALLDRSQLAGPSEFTAQQADLAALLQGQIAGTAGPSLAEQLLKAEQDKQLNQQLALAATIGGRAAPVAQRQIQQQQALGGQEALRQAAILRSQEQLAAQQQLGGVLGQARSQDQARAQLLAELAQADQAAKQQAAIKSAEQSLAAQTFTAEQEQAKQIAQEQADQARRETQARLEMAAAQAQADKEAAALQARGQALGTLASAGATIAGS